MIKTPEILAPAGNFEAAVAAAEAGADAVYFGLSSFNARRRADNIPPEKLSELTAYLHSKNVKAFLTLNTDLSRRELAEAARCYQLAKIAKIDAVIVKDLAFFILKDFFRDEMKLYISTQTGISSSSGVETALSLGASRAILSRELSADEIKSATSIDNIEVEIFVQGAMCFSISGRCLLSSWIGGRSGNRGLCASPCRIEWLDERSGEISRCLSMKDLSLLGNLKELAGLGVSSFKIEGRMKNPEWVYNAVKTVRLARDGNLFSGENSKRLGNYAGREMTNAFYIGNNTGLIAASGREKTSFSEYAAADEEKESLPKKQISLSVGATPDGKLSFNAVFGEKFSEIRLCDRKMTKNENRTITVEIAIQNIADEFKDIIINADKSLFNSRISRSDAAKIRKMISSFIQQISKKQKDLLKIDLPETLLSAIRATIPACEIRKNRPDRPDRLRLSACNLPPPEEITPELEPIIECYSQEEILQIAEKFTGRKFIAALPSVFYERDIPEIKEMLSLCAKSGIRAELNNLDAISIAEKTGTEWEAGPGLMVLNPFAAELLARKGSKGVTASLEADLSQIEDLLISCRIPLTVYVFGRPKLMQTRVGFPPNKTTLREKRGTAMSSFFAGNHTVFYPVMPFRMPFSPALNLSNAHFGLDLVFSPRPTIELKEWKNLPAVSFNLERKLR
jgi:putative protease